MSSDRIDNGIYRLKVPFEDLYTTVYAVLGRDGELIIIDAATYPEDVDRKIIVAAHEYDPLGSMAVGKEAVKAYLDACLEEVNGRMP